MVVASSIFDEGVSLVPSRKTGDAVAQLLLFVAFIIVFLASPPFDEGASIVASHKTGDAVARLLLCIRFIIFAGRFMGMSFTIRFPVLRSLGTGKPPPCLA